MGRFRSFFTGSRPSKSRETVAELRKQSSDIKIRARALKKLADEERDMAKEFLRDGSKDSATKALIRRKKYQKDLSSLYSKAATVNSVIEAMAKAEQNDKLLKVLGASKTVLDHAANEDRLTQAEEIMTGLEAAIENVDYIDERLTESAVLDDPLDIELADIGDELNVLMSEIQNETAPARTQVTPSITKPTGQPSRVGAGRKVLEGSMNDFPSVSSTSAGNEDKREHELREEIERIKREMKEELG
ncbi:MAG: Snf7 family protein [Candidatus Hodarchaeales archaeon]|jgi:hypothetical protein